MTKIKISTLKNQAAFNLANKVGKKQTSRFFILLNHTNTPYTANTLFLGLKISRKVGKAVVRNKIRRRFKAILRNIAHETEPHLWESRVFVLIPRKGLEAVKFQEVQQELLRAIKISIKGS